MTKQHFEAVAAEFKNAVQHATCTANYEDSNAPLNAVKMTIHGFCNAAARANPRFDRARFIKACGIN